MAKLLLVEDDPSLATLVTYNLEAEGHEVIHTSDGEEAELLVIEEAPDLLLLDWMLPNVSGIEICRRVRMSKDGARIPIIMLTARGEEADRVRGLETGADDYITKPFSIAELLARIKSLLRRAYPDKMAKTLTVGEIIMDKEAHKVTRNGRMVRLGPTEYKLLEHFMSAPGRVHSRSQLLDNVWGQGVYVDDRTVDVHVGRLRKAINRGKEKDPIRTVRGAGYTMDR